MSKDELITDYPPKVLNARLRGIREKLNWKKVKFLKLTMEMMDYNVEMISGDEEDIITLFLEGIITGLQLRKFLDAGLPEEIKSL